MLLRDRHRGRLGVPKAMRAAFLDLNGTLVMPVRVARPQEYSLIPGAIEGIRLLNLHRFICPVITVQSRISKGMYSYQEFLDWFEGLRALLRQEGAEILGPYVCPHQGRDDCGCKKPKQYLYQQAAADYGIDVRQSVVIGDTLDDVRAAQALPSPSCLVRTGWGERALAEQNAYTTPTQVAAVYWMRLAGQSSKCGLAETR